MLAETAHLLQEIQRRADSHQLEGMKRYGIRTDRAWGVSNAQLEPLAKPYRRRHDIAQELWATGIREPRLVAAYVADAKAFSVAAMDAWAADFDSWDVCDHVCRHAFLGSPYAWNRAFAWSRRRPEFVRRAGFVMMAWLAVHDRMATTRDFARCFAAITRGAADERNLVKKAVSWALRQIGKRGPDLLPDATQVAQALCDSPHAAARWIGRDALRDWRQG